MFCIDEQYKVDIYDALAELRPTPPHEAVCDILFGEETITAAGPRGYESRNQLFRVGNKCDGGISFPPPLVAVMCDRLKAEGAEVTIRDRRDYSRLDVDPQAMRRAEYDEAVIAKAIAENEYGQIQVQSGEETYQHIAFISRLLPKAQILIRVPTHGAAKSLQRKLNDKYDVRARWFRQGGPRSRIAIGTAHWMRTWRFDSRDVMLLPEPHRMLSTTALNEMRYPPRGCRRIYSFIRADRKWTNAETVVLQSFSGPVIVRRFPPCVGVWQLILSTPSFASPTETNGVEFKRQAYWRNQRRNEFVSAVARAFAICDAPRLRRYGISFTDDEPNIRGGATPNVTVLVESPEHGHELLSRLPGWTLRRLDRSDEGKATQTSGESQGVIATVACAVKYGVQADVLIVASGEPAQLHLSDFPPRRGTGEERDALIVDFDDRHSEEMDRRFRKREHDGLRRGWRRIDNQAASR